MTWRYRGLLGRKQSRWSWTFTLAVQVGGGIAAYFLAAESNRQLSEAEDALGCTVGFRGILTVIEILAPILMNLLLYLLTITALEPAVMGTTNSSIAEGSPNDSLPMRFSDLPSSFVFKFYSATRADKVIRTFQADEEKRRELILAGERPGTLENEHIDAIISQVNALLLGLEYDGVSLLRRDYGRVQMFAFVNVSGSIISLALAYSTLGKCSKFQLFGQYLQFISVTTLLFIALAAFAGYATYKSLLLHEVTQAELEDVSDVISLFVANTGRRIRGIRSNSNSSYAEADDKGKYGVYVPVISDHVFMRKLKVKGNDALRYAHEDGEVMSGLYLIGGRTDSDTALGSGV